MGHGFLEKESYARHSASNANRQTVRCVSQRCGVGCEATHLVGSIARVQAGEKLSDRPQ